uniref:Gram-negative bacteria-binding protein 2 n=3 Tax=Lygus hesperus TaxID=30085 RepID=A0A0A9WTF5_LYGHE
MRGHAENLWKISHPENTGTTTSKPRHDIDVLVVTPSGVTPKITTTEPPPPPPPQFDETDSLDLRGPCLPAKTEVSNKGPDGRWKRRKICTGSVIFEDNFSRGPGVDNTKWSHEVKMPGRKAYHGFVTYQESLRNCYVKGNTLTIKPSVLDDTTTRNGTRYLENCTGLPDTEECYRTAKSFEILPPIDSALLTTKHIMSFKYGKIEIRAKLPIGDWIVPEITLEPVSTQTYGNEYSGRIRLAFARGNLRLMQDTKYVGNRHLEMGFEIGHRNLPRLVEYDNEEGWGRAFHNYTLIWTPDNLKFQVDDGTPEPLCFPGHPLYRALGLTINEGKKKPFGKGPQT